MSFIESDRSAPGRGMVVRLAEALEVPLRDRNALLLAAGYAPAYEETSLEGPELAPVRAALEGILEGHLPNPGVVAYRRGDLVSNNDAFWSVAEGVAPELLRAPLNVPRLFLHPRGIAPRIVNFDEWAWHVINALHREALRNPDEQLDALVGELEELAPKRPAAGRGPPRLRGSPAAALERRRASAHHDAGAFRDGGRRHRLGAEAGGLPAGRRDDRVGPCRAGPR